jgi:hypothetical protein
MDDDKASQFRFTFDQYKQRHTKNVLYGTFLRNKVSGLKQVYDQNQI